MSTYAIEDYLLRIVNAFETLEVVDRSTSIVEETFDLNDSLKISVNSGDYLLAEDTCDTCFALVYDPAEGDSMSFDNNKMIGVTIVRIECKTHEYTYFLDECPVYLHYDNGNLEVKGPADTAGTSYCPECIDYAETPIPNCP